LIDVYVFVVLLVVVFSKEGHLHKRTDS
jgi:hypothetical protein